PLGYDLVWQPYLSILPISFGCSRRGEGLKKVKKSLLDLFTWNLATKSLLMKELNLMLVESDH
ncbi:Uncharacterized protein APZ42_007194, partial [Daphnia magna]